MRPTQLVLIVAAIGSTATALAQESDPADRAQALDDEVLHLASERVLWPGFEPTAIPLAIFDGERTYLFRHPRAPEGFGPIDLEPIDLEPLDFEPTDEVGSRGSVYVGRYPAVTSNTYADIGGTMSATVMLDGKLEGPLERADLARLAAVALHEAFHVFQQRKHPGWQANEADLFVYPVEDADLLALRRLETEALRRALSAVDQAESACWAIEALAQRRHRFDALGESFVAYERGTELNEGLAAYVQLRAEGSRAVDIPETGFSAADVRRRAYSTGPAIALLLDRFQPHWAVAFEAAESGSLDEALFAAVEDRSTTDCVFEPTELADVTRVAQSDVEALLASRGEARRRFEARAGWRVVVEAEDGRPLWPQRFDPLNVQRLDGGVLHGRFLKLGNESGELEAIDTGDTDLEALTVGAGEHPLFNGVRRVVIAGLGKPVVETEAGVVTVRTDGFSADFSAAEVRWAEEELVLRLLPAD